jgi:hypothetical protein
MFGYVKERKDWSWFLGWLLGGRRGGVGELKKS